MSNPDQDSTNSVADPLSACALPSNARTSASEAFAKPDSEWRKLLTADQFRVMRQHGTEPPFQNAYWDKKDQGLYLCAACAAPLFASAQKYDSRSGWPSFWQTIEPEYVGETRDESHGMIRTEVHCNRCGGHLGHVFPDGPKPTGLRYCINSASINFVPGDALESKGLGQYSDQL